MTKIFLYSWNEHSKGARLLTKELGIKRIKHEGSHFKPNSSKTVINWGAGWSFPSNWPIGDQVNIINRPVQVSQCQNKSLFFQMLHPGSSPVARTPRYSCGVKPTWGTIVVERHVLNGHSGNGIKIKEPGEELSDAPLYVEYVKKDSEYRIHLMRIGGQIEVIDIQRKIRDPNRVPTDWKVRSHANGFIFVRNGVTPPEDVVEQARLAFVVSALDFGAVDVLYNKSKQSAYVLEINTAPGLCGTTVKKYAEGFKRMLNL